jgi:hypothetical protein
VLGVVEGDDLDAKADSHRQPGGKLPRISALSQADEKIDVAVGVIVAARARAVEDR